MTDVTAEPEEAPKKASKLPLILGLVVALAGGGGAFFAIYSGMILGGDAPVAGEEAHGEAAPAEDFKAPDMAYLALQPMVISMGRIADNRHLRFTASLEIPPDKLPEVEKIQPRIVDVLNSYMRALRIDDLEDPAALVRLRAQMLRRIQAITGPEAVRDLLITEFVLN
ncbi:flagellar basal body-associated FliL family protein [Pseudooceanicola sp. CBS1P-1]|uniref:Flagellar protein FliL n=1 Tax=Pseudooceanicola albus TaxID=2692189 RepID=A0A6L7G7P0_9RHOB|nr:MULTISPECIES: flagellar basal body-associated FliL family protein [Pseudooceanicola]MBT9385870.1 flagellar basal body-associated FliL family protein [Pseudooceanicola endophyticus]MXN20101.1 flagellar basal body protein FliL [Pseudooceanicola albus]